MKKPYVKPALTHLGLLRLMTHFYGGPVFL